MTAWGWKTQQSIHTKCSPVYLVFWPLLHVHHSHWPLWILGYAIWAGQLTNSPSVFQGFHDYIQCFVIEQTLVMATAHSKQPSHPCLSSNVQILNALSSLEQYSPIAMALLLNSSLVPSTPVSSRPWRSTMILVKRRCYPSIWHWGSGATDLRSFFVSSNDLPPQLRLHLEWVTAEFSPASVGPVFLFCFVFFWTLSI